MKNLTTEEEPLSLPSPTPLPPSNSGRRQGRWLIAGVACLLIVVAIAYLTYNIGLGQGRSTANEERDAFYRSRAGQLGGFGATGTITATTTGSPLVPSVTAGSGRGQDNVFARIDKVEGDKLTLAMLGANGLPNGQTMVLTLGKDAQLYQTSSIATQQDSLRSGDNILLAVGKDSNGTSIIQMIIILPATG